MPKCHPLSFRHWGCQSFQPRVNLWWATEAWALRAWSSSVSLTQDGHFWTSTLSWLVARGSCLVLELPHPNIQMSTCLHGSSGSALPNAGEVGSRNWGGRGTTGENIATKHDRLETQVTYPQLTINQQRTLLRLNNGEGYFKFYFPQSPLIIFDLAYAHINL